MYILVRMNIRAANCTCKSLSYYSNIRPLLTGNPASKDLSFLHIPLRAHIFPLRFRTTKFIRLNSSTGRHFLRPFRYLSTTTMAHGMKGDHPSWNYDDQSAWGRVKGWEVANTGKRQSPIDIQTSVVTINKDLKALEFKDWDIVQNGVFKNTGHSMQFTPDSSDVAYLTTPHGTYSFKQFHFHWGSSSHTGSEHHIDGTSYSTEIHFVHGKTSGPNDAEDSLAVLAVLCDADSSYQSRGTPWERLEIPQEIGQAISGVGIDMSKFLPSKFDYYHYKGSLTTPPCTETVMWYVLKQPIKVPEDFLEKLRQMKDEFGHCLTHNYRQCMPLHGRSIETPQSA